MRTTPSIVRCWLVAALLVPGAVGCGRPAPPPKVNLVADARGHDDGPRPSDDVARQQLVTQCAMQQETLTTPEDGRALLAKACSLGDGEGCQRMGHLYACGVSVRSDPAVAFGFYERACTLKHGQGCVFAATFLEHGIGVKRDEKRSHDLLERTCKANVGASCRALAFELYEHDPAANIARVAALLRAACDTGYGKACADLGRLYAVGQGSVRKDEEQGYGLAKRGCELGDADACAAVGLMTFLGTGVAKDKAAGLALFLAACEKGSGDGCDSAGRALASGEVGTPDPARAVDLFQRACKMGYGPACRQAADVGGARPTPHYGAPIQGHF